MPYLHNKCNVSKWNLLLYTYALSNILWEMCCWVILSFCKCHRGCLHEPRQCCYGAWSWRTTTVCVVWCWWKCHYLVHDCTLQASCSHLNKWLYHLLSDPRIMLSHWLLSPSHTYVYMGTMGRQCPCGEMSSGEIQRAQCTLTRTVLTLQGSLLLQAIMRSAPN